jgi:hypothetical protein
MGALRAAELAPFGMCGIGKISEALLSGELERDDAVAIEHGPAELGYPAVSVALVDIEATAEKAARERVITSEQRCQLMTIARRKYFKDRIYPHSIGEAQRHFGDLTTWDRFADWLPQGRVSQRRVTRSNSWTLSIQGPATCQSRMCRHSSLK